MPDSAPRLIAGNLDCEVDFAATAGRSDSGEPGTRRAVNVRLPLKVRRVISALATLLRGCARPGDELWTPHAIDPARVLPVPGLAQPRLQTGPQPAALAYGSVLAWGETEQVSGWRRLTESRSSITRDTVSPPAPDRSLPLYEALWRLPAPDPRATATLNDRATTLAMARELDCVRPATGVVRSLADVEARMAKLPAADAAWVLKAPFSAAGRFRLLGRGRELADSIARRQAARLLATFGALLFEPWVDRTRDFGCGAVIAPAETRVVTIHETHVDAYGRFRGLTLCAERGDRAPGLGDAERARLIGAALAVGRHLEARGYRGPFGLDAWRYRDDQDPRSERFQPLGEVNARMTFGIVARCLAERLQEVHHWKEGTLLRLRFSTDPPDEPGGPSLRDRIPLLAPAPPDGVGAWVDVLGDTGALPAPP